MYNGSTAEIRVQNHEPNLDDEDEYPTQHYDDPCEWDFFTYQELLQGALDCRITPC